MYKKILLATDGSEHSMNAAKKVVELQKEWNASIEIFHSVNHHLPLNTIPFPFPFQNTSRYQISDAEYSKMQETFRMVGEKILEQTKKVFDDAGIKVTTKLILDIDPGDYAKEAVKTKKFDLVVVGAKGHHGKIHQFILGSVCQKIINEVDCSVMLIR